MIELNGLTKSFDNKAVIKGIDLFIQEGEIFGLIGKSGAGKSTLLRCINLLERPEVGQVIVDNQTISDYSVKQLRQARFKIGMIFQHFNLLFSQTVRENIALPMRIQKMDTANIEKKVDELLALVELTDKQNAYPSQLSGGQKQRVAIARALSTEPKILLCDEATSALDPETTDSILHLLKKINQLLGITIVLVTHEMDVIKRVCHRLGVMEAGELIEVTGLATAFHNKNSVARKRLFANLSPALPTCLMNALSEVQSNKPFLRLFFHGDEVGAAFISQASRELKLDIAILLANLDRFDTLTCGVVILELTADLAMLTAFMKRCEQHGLTVEILGYGI